LTEEQQRIVNEVRVSHPNPRVRGKMPVIWLLHYGATREHAVVVVGMPRSTIQHYYVIRRTRLDLKELYRSAGPYWYSSGFNPVALIALVIGIARCVLGFLGTIGAIDVSPIWTSLYSYAWFISFGLSAASYVVLTKGGWFAAGWSKPRCERELLD